jgi:hypothetical protein
MNSLNFDFTGFFENKAGPGFIHGFPRVMCSEALAGIG